jgi:hypothetical protein
MMSTLGIEWIKVRNYRTFWILFAITIVCIPAFNYSFYDFTDNTFPKIKGQSILGTPFSFPNVWQTVSFNSSLLLFIPAVLIITLTTNEYAYRTHRQNIIDGWSRNQFILVKLFEVFLFSCIVTLVVFITAFVFGLTVKAPEPSSYFTDSWYVLNFFVQMISYSSIAFLLGMLIRRAGLSMGIFFVYMFIEQFVVAIGRNKFHVKWVNYLPEEVTDVLIPQPYSPRAFRQGNSQDWKDHLPIYLSVAAAYLLIYVFIGVWRFRKSDL